MNLPVLFFLICLLSYYGQCLEMKDGAYDDFVVSISDSVPVTNCRTILKNLEVSDPKR